MLRTIACKTINYKSVKSSIRIVDGVLVVAAFLYGLLLARHPASGAMTIAIGFLGLLMFLGACFRPFELPTARKAALAWIGGALLFHGFANSYFFWPLHLLVPLVALFVSASLGGWLGALAVIFVSVRLNQIDLVGIVLVALIGGGGLNLWIRIVSPDVDALRAMIPHWHPVALIVAGLAFAVVNAVLEEIAWRGIIMRWLLDCTPPAAAVVLQGLSFGFAHWNGFPNGAAGIALAAGYGMILGLMALRSGGLGSAIFAHIAADLVIFASLAAR